MGKGRPALFAMLINAFFVSMMSGYINLKALCITSDVDVLSSITYRGVSLSEYEQKLLYYYSMSDDGTKELMRVNEDVLSKVVYNNIYAALTEDKRIGNCASKAPAILKMLLPADIYSDCYDAYYSIINDIKYFPVAKDNMNNVEVSYEDGWGDARNYGGERLHEGTDIMSGNNEEGYFPIVSMTDGVVEKKGWLELGGYRLGIRSPSGAYYYYAHLSSYAEGIVEGKKVKAGSIIGTMGSTGYGEEGTLGKFDVHLHLGIYYGEDEISFNPYNLLNICRNSMLGFEIVDN